MGTEILLKWDGMTEEEVKLQVAAAREFRLNAGRLGYLRAAVGMKRENALLRLVFPLEYWYNPTGEPMPFNFQLAATVLHRGARVYIQSVREGKIPDFKDYALSVAMEDATNRAVEEAGFQKVSSSTGDLEYEAAREWVEELAEFFELGKKKQDDGLNPGILISW